MLTEEQLLAVRAGTLSFNQFARAARPDFHALAARLLSKFPGVYTLDPDDLVQVMLMQAFVRVGQWRPGSYPLKKYVLFWAHSRAFKLCLHQARRSNVIKLGVLPPNELHPVVTSLSHTQAAEPLQELELEVVECLRDLPTNPRQVAIMNSVFETQDVDASLEQLLRDPHTRAMFGGSRDAERRGIYRTVTKLTRRAQRMAR